MKGKTLLAAIVLALVNVMVIAYFWFHGSYWHLVEPWPGSYLIAVGRLFGLLGQFLLLVELVLVGRIMPLERVIGYEKMNRWHRWIGGCILILLIPHPLLLAWGYNRGSLDGIWLQMLSFIQDWEDVLRAVVALAVMGLIVLISYRPLRRRMSYEIWYILHLATYIAIALAFGHQIKSGDMAGGLALYYWVVLNLSVFGIMLGYRLGKPLYLNRRHAFKVWKVVQETPDTYSVYVRGRDLSGFAYEAGQYAYLNTHPLSFSSAPNGNHLRFTIKTLGDYTKRVTSIKPGAMVYLDGPHGVFTTSRSKNDRFLFIAGGIGITPLRAMLEECVRAGKDVTLLYACRDMKSVALLKELQNICAASKSKCRMFLALSDEKKATGQEQGIVDEEKIKRLVPDFKQRDTYICGPPPMILALNKQLKSMGVSRKQIHFELFAF